MNFLLSNYFRLALVATAIIMGAQSHAALINIADDVSRADGWSTDFSADNGVDFFTLDVTQTSNVFVNVTSSAIDFGISVYTGIVDDPLGFFFDNDGDINNLFSGEVNSFVGGNDPFFGPLNALSLPGLTAGTYTVAIGGADFDLFGAPFAYEASIETVAVPEPSGVLLMLLGLLSLSLMQRRRQRS